jgi:GTP-binding protein Era
MTFLSGFIAIVGPSNVGKSTLLNRILGTKVAIVSPKPQTTRNRILGVLHGEGFQIVFLDTPGIHRTSTSLHRSMVASAQAALKEVDRVLLMIEMSRPHGLHMPLVLSSLRRANKPALLVINKIDQGPKENLLPIMEEYGHLHPFEAMIPVCSLTGDGIDVLMKELRKGLKPGPQFFPEDLTTDQTETFLISETIREKIYFHVRQELPYSCAVTVERMEERPQKGLLFISALIHVETNSQKGILIGEKGRMVRAIGQAARMELERILGVQVYLELSVRVDRNWSKNPKALRRLGY